MSWSTIGTLLIFVAVFAVGAMAVGFFKAAWQQRKIDKAAEKQKQAEKEEAEKLARAKRQEKNKPKVKRLGE